MEKFTFVFENEAGLKAKESEELIKELENYSSQVTFKKNHNANARLIFNLLSLNISQGDSVEVLVEGEDEVKDSEALEKFMSAKFK